MVITRYSSVLALLAAVLTVLGCASPPVDQSVGANGSAAQSSEKPNRLAQLAGRNNGLEVRKWVITDDPGRIAASITTMTESDVLEPGEADVLRQNGFRLVRLPIDQLDSFQSALGGASVNVDVWYGQVDEWATVHDMAAPPASRPIGIDGHLERFESGRLWLRVRAWIMPMEDGPKMMFEMAPQHHVRRVSEFRQMLENVNGNTRDRRFDSMYVHKRLEPGYAYVLTGEAPGVDWAERAEQVGRYGDEQPEDDENGRSTNDASGANPSADAGNRVNHDTNTDAPDRFGSRIGPAYDAPPTLGQYLLDPPGSMPPKRGFIVFVPHIDDVLFPGEPLQARESPARNRQDAEHERGRATQSSQSSEQSNSSSEAPS